MSGLVKLKFFCTAYKPSLMWCIFDRKNMKVRKFLIFVLNRNPVLIMQIFKFFTQWLILSELEPFCLAHIYYMW